MHIRKFANRKSELIITIAVAVVVTGICMLLVGLVARLVSKTQGVFEPARPETGGGYFNFEKYDEVVAPLIPAPVRTASPTTSPR